MFDAPTILVIIDPAAERAVALQRALWLAKRLGGSVELFVCDYDQYLAGTRFFDARARSKARESLLTHHEKRLEKLAAESRGEGIAVAIEAVWDRPLHEAIVRKALRCEADLVVKETHYHSPLRRSVFSNADWDLIRDCPVPLLLVKPHDMRSQVSLIAAVDPMHEHDKPGDLDRRILDAGFALADKLGAQLDVFHAFDPSPAYAVSADSMAFPISTPMTELMQGLRKGHKEAMDRLLASYELPADRVHILEGDIGEQLLTLADRLHSDVVIMGAVARGPIKRWVLGSTAERMLDRVPCDLLIVKPSGFVTSVQTT